MLPRAPFKPILYRYASRCLLFGLASLVGCASAGDIFEEGLALEASGDAAGAARRYIDALEKDRSLENVRLRLQEAGAVALEDGLTLAERQTTPPEEGGRGVLRLDQLIDDAAAVGVRLVPPERFETRRVTLLTEASDALEERARLAEQQQDWSEARSALREVRLDLAPSDERSRMAGEAEARVLQRWAEQDLDEQYFRAAFEHAAEALELPATSSVRQAARGIQDTAVELGRVYVAALPARLSDGLTGDGEVSPEFTRALDDALDLDHWPNPPLFIAMVPPAETRRALRLGSGPGPLDSRDIRLLLDDLDAQVAVVIEITEIDAEKSGVDQEVVEIALETGGTASTRLEKGRLRYTVRADVEVLDERGNRIRRSSVSAQASDRYELGIYEGDVRALRLSRRQREQFDPQFIAAQRREIQERAAAELADDVARRVFDGASGTVR